MIDDDTAELLVLEYEHGADTDMIATEYGVSGIGVRNLLHRRNAKRRAGTRVETEEVPSRNEPRYARPLRPDCELHSILDVAREYKKGFSMRQLSAVFGVSRHKLRKELIAIGVEIRTPGLATSVSRAGNCPQDIPCIEELERDYEAGKSLSALSRRAGVCHHTIRAALKRRGVILRDHREAINFRDNRKDVPDIERAFKLFKAGKYTVRQLEALCGVSRFTIRRRFKELE